ncbi:MAG: pyridoxal-phosphate dependent enzyme, partial [Mycobacteriaceae bacterium]|nr:pyridoxal-phosphate dependent enzyme [Mycobacteriaceae bacterium]
MADTLDGTGRVLAGVDLIRTVLSGIPTVLLWAIFGGEFPEMNLSKMWTLSQEWDAKARMFADLGTRLEELADRMERHWTDSSGPADGPAAVREQAKSMAAQAKFCEGKSDQLRMAVADGLTDQLEMAIFGALVANQVAMMAGAGGIGSVAGFAWMREARLIFLRQVEALAVKLSAKTTGQTAVRVGALAASFGGASAALDAGLQLAEVPLGIRRLDEFDWASAGTMFLQGAVSVGAGFGATAAGSKFGPKVGQWTQQFTQVRRGPAGRFIGNAAERGGRLLERALQHQVTAAALGGAAGAVAVPVALAAVAGGEFQLNGSDIAVGIIQGIAGGMAEHNIPQPTAAVPVAESVRVWGDHSFAAQLGHHGNPHAERLVMSERVREGAIDSLRVAPQQAHLNGLAHEQVRLEIDAASLRHTPGDSDAAARLEHVESRLAEVDRDFMPLRHEQFERNGGLVPHRAAPVDAAGPLAAQTVNDIVGRQVLDRIPTDGVSELHIRNRIGGVASVFAGSVAETMSRAQAHDVLSGMDPWSTAVVWHGNDVSVWAASTDGTVVELNRSDGRVCAADSSDSQVSERVQVMFIESDGSIDRAPTSDEREQARRDLAGYESTIVSSPELNQRSGATLHIALENAPSIKARVGALIQMNGLSELPADAHLVTASTGNHGLAIAEAARRCGVRATVVVPEPTPAHKVRRIEEHGARVVRHGATWDESHRYAKRLTPEGQGIYLSASSPEAVAAQGTVVSTLLDQHPEAEAVVLVGGSGGLASAAGVVRDHEFRNGEQRRLVVVAVPESAPTLYESFKARELRSAPANTVADAANSTQMDRHLLSDLLNYADDVVLVPDAALQDTGPLLMQTLGGPVEPTGALGVAAILANDGRLTGATGRTYDVRGKDVLTVVTGGNIPNPHATFDSPDRMADLAALARDVFGPSGYRPEDVQGLDFMAQLLNNNDNLTATPVDAEAFHAMLRDNLGLDAEADLPDVRQLTDAVRAYLDTSEQWLPTSVAELRDYAELLGSRTAAPDSDNARQLLREFGDHAGMGPEQYGRFLEPMRHLVDLVEHDPKRALTPGEPTPATYQDLVAYSCEVLNQHRESQYQPEADDSAPVFAALNAAYANEKFGLPGLSTGRTDRRLMLGASARLQELLAGPETPHGDPLPIRGIAGLAHDLNAAPPERRMLKHADPYDLHMRYRAAHQDLGRPLTVDDLHTWKHSNPTADYSLFGPRKYREDNYQFDVEAGHETRAQWVTRRLVQKIEPDDINVCRELFHTLGSEYGVRYGQFDSAVIIANGVNSYPFEVLKRLGVASVDGVVFAGNYPEQLYLQAEMGDYAYREIRADGVPRSAEVRGAQDHWVPVIDELAQPHIPRPDEPVQSRFTMLRGQIFDYLPAWVQGDFSHLMWTDDGKAPRSLAEVPAADGAKVYPIAIDPFTIDSIFGALSTELTYLTPDERSALHDRVWSRVDENTRRELQDRVDHPPAGDEPPLTDA